MGSGDWTLFFFIALPSISAILIGPFLSFQTLINTFDNILVNQCRIAVLIKTPTYLNWEADHRAFAQKILFRISVHKR